MWVNSEIKLYQKFYNYCRIIKWGWTWRDTNDELYTHFSLVNLILSYTSRKDLLCSSLKFPNSQLFCVFQDSSSNLEIHTFIPHCILSNSVQKFGHFHCKFQEYNFLDSPIFLCGSLPFLIVIFNKIRIYHLSVVITIFGQVWTLSRKLKSVNEIPYAF